MSRQGPIWLIVLCVLVAASGCRRANQAPDAEEPPARPTGRIVPAVVAGFERGVGGWTVEATNAGPATLSEPLVVEGDAARGDHWLAIPVASSEGGESVIDAGGDVPSGDWLRFGDTLRAEVRVTPGGVSASVQPFLVAPDGEETLGEAVEVTTDWTALVWKAGPALGNVARIGLRWRVSGAWTGRLGVDNIRVGAADALSTAYSVAYGPFASREIAAQTMATLKADGIDSFPIYEEGWYLNLGTFSTRDAANREARRLKGEGFATTVLIR